MPSTDEKGANKKLSRQFATYFKHRSDVHIGYIRNDRKEQPHAILTDALDAYNCLIEQAFRTFHTEDFSDDQALVTSARKIVAHEEEHGAAIRTVGSYTPFHYGIELARHQLDDGQLKPEVARVFTSFGGYFRKIDWAFIIAAPTAPSDSDLNLIHALGYESAEEVRARRAELSTGRLSKPEILRLAARAIDWWTQPLW